MTVTQLREVIVGNARPPLGVLFASAAFLLLIACANVANLLLTRSVARQKEIAIRLALGARSWHIVRQCLVESLVLSTMGGMLGVLAARAGLAVLVPLIGTSVPRVEAVSIDLRVLLFSLGIAIGTAVREIDPNLPLHRIMPLEEVVARTMSERRLAFGLLAGFAAMAVLLAALGVYAAVANAVAQRRQEIGIRLALGATRGAIVNLVMLDGLLMVGAGGVAGVAFGVLATRLMRSLLFDVSPVDPISFVAAVLILSAIACAACYIPARKAATVDPATAVQA